MLLHSFWRSTVSQESLEDQLTSAKFMSLCDVNEVIEFVKQSDYVFYQFLIEILIPDPLGNIPNNLVPTMRQLAKNLEAWSRNALSHVPARMRHSKMCTVQAFSMTLKRYTLLNHLIITVKNTLQNENVLRIMSNGLNKIDLNHIKVIFFISHYFNFIYVNSTKNKNKTGTSQLDRRL